MRLKVAALVAGIALTFGASPLRAHHSLEDTNDLRRTVTLTGVVSSLEPRAESRESSPGLEPGAWSL